MPKVTKNTNRLIKIASDKKLPLKDRQRAISHLEKEVDQYSEEVKRDLDRTMSRLNQELSKAETIAEMLTDSLDRMSPLNETDQQEADKIFQKAMDEARLEKMTKLSSNTTYRGATPEQLRQLDALKVPTHEPTPPKKEKMDTKKTDETKKTVTPKSTPEKKDYLSENGKNLPLQIAKDATIQTHKNLEQAKQQMLAAKAIFRGNRNQQNFHDYKRAFTAHKIANKRHETAIKALSTMRRWHGVDLSKTKSHNPGVTASTKAKSILTALKNTTNPDRFLQATPASIDKTQKEVSLNEVTGPVPPPSSLTEISFLEAIYKTISEAVNSLINMFTNTKRIDSNAIHTQDKTSADIENEIERPSGPK